MDKRLEQFLNGTKEIGTALKGGAFDLQQLQSMRDVLMIFVRGIDNTMKKAAPVQQTTIA